MLVSIDRCRMLLLRVAVCCSGVLALLTRAGAQNCITPREGHSDFMLNTKDSVAAGATYISNPSAGTPEACLSACCQHARCNLAMVQPEGDKLTNCFLFNCLYRNQFVCSFVKKSGFIVYMQNSVYKKHLSGPEGKKDKHPIANPGADIVVQPGESVYLNGIESWDDRKIIKYEWTLLSGDPSVVIQQTAFLDQRLLLNLHPAVYRFQLRVTDSAGQSDTASVTVLVLTQEQAENLCLTPMKVGPCRGSFPRWHFNAASGVCEKFMFGGCKPNDNNYVSQQECSEACNGTKVIPEGRKLQIEVCNSSCGEEQFTCSNLCCVDGSLECDGDKHCSDGSDEENCQRMNRTLAQLLEIDVEEKNAWCVVPPATGPCRASMPHWFYDPLKQSCFSFTYGGCSGNKNRFQKKEVCMKSCSGVTESDVLALGPYERFNSQKPTTGSVATGVIVAVLIVALIGLLGFCYLRNRKRKLESRQSVPAAATPPVPQTEDSHTLIERHTQI
ncbi:kunitz-type protease inhibitor 1-like isoform X2 [Neoarius graeffei]|uniref:kunitz-type protease inhibitor 1-like isoform X2 n=1 Tax=Neoarius graeffei TaxID=443677 RepID=UPI00298C962A|nr:kunitz-type protease inhibitor 1-like isoform X2 [Neoarius graeffei]